MKGAGSAGQEEELEFVKNIFIINKQGWKGAGEAAEDLDGQKDSGILAPSPHSDGFHLCLRRDILGSWWPSGSLSPGLMLGALSQARCVWVRSVKCTIFGWRWEECEGMGGHAIWVREGSALLIPDLSPPPNLCGL